MTVEVPVFNTKEAEKFVGKIYCPNGRDMSGTDCVGLLRLVLKIYQPYVYSRMVNETMHNGYLWVPVRAITELKRYYEVVDIETNNGGKRFDFFGLKPLDVVLFKMREPKNEFRSHIGIVCGGGKFLHTLLGANAVLGDFSRKVWQRFFIGAFRGKK